MEASPPSGKHVNIHIMKLYCGREDGGHQTSHRLHVLDSFHIVNSTATCSNISQIVNLTASLAPTSKMPMTEEELWDTSIHYYGHQYSIHPLICLLHSVT